MSSSSSPSSLLTLHEMSAFRAISQFAWKLNFSDIPFIQRKHAARYLADSLACALAARASVCHDKRHPLQLLAQQAQASTGKSQTDDTPVVPLWGHHAKAVGTPLTAALYHSTLIRHLDCNDFYMPPPPYDAALCSSHASDGIGGMWSFVSTKKNHHTELVTAMVVLYEIQSALGRCIPWFNAGFHSISQLLIAIPATSAVLEKEKWRQFVKEQIHPDETLDEQATENAIVEFIIHSMGIAFSSSLVGQTWLRRFNPPFSSPFLNKASTTGVPSIKSLACGLISQRAVEAVDMAKIGFTAPEDSFETFLRFHREGDNAKNAVPTEEELQPIRELGVKWTMQDHLIKSFSAQFNLQSAIFCMLTLVKQHPSIQPKKTTSTPSVYEHDIESIEVFSHVQLCAGVQGSKESYRPKDHGAADHSTPFVLTMCLLFGTFDTYQVYQNKLWLSTEVHQLMDLIKLHVDPEFEENRTKKGKLGCRIQITLKNGQVLSHLVEQTPGHPARPLTDDELFDKIERLLKPFYPATLPRQLLDLCLKMADDDHAVQSSSKTDSLLIDLEKLLSTEPIA